MVPLSDTLYAGQARNLTGQNTPGLVTPSSESGFVTSDVTGTNGAIAGLADSGTRVKAVIGNIPAGVSVYVPVYNAQPPAVPGGKATSSFAALINGEAASDGSGVLPAVTGSYTYGGLPVAQLPVVNGSATAVWEIVNTSPLAREYLEFPVLVSYGGGITPPGSPTIKGSLAPNSDQGAFPESGAAAAENSTYPVPRFSSNLAQDGSVLPTGGTVQDAQFGSRASITFPSGAVSTSTTVTINVLGPQETAPLPPGFSGADTYFVNIQLNPEPAFPLPPPGLTVVLPLTGLMQPGAAIYLYRVNTATGVLEPSLDTSGFPVVGYVNTTGDRATFTGISRLSTVVGLQSLPIQLQIDIKPGDGVNSINQKSHGVIPVLIYGTSTLDASKINVSTLRLSGAGVSQNSSGKYNATGGDYNGDGFKDLLVHFDTDTLQLPPGATTARLDGRTLDFREIWGQDSVRIVH
ncbi:MAG: hypothetical protein M1541_22070 [Acidobacteria bacterium]|nr:hypothetical protein [Acidobacteriota bacterium]